MNKKYLLWLCCWMAPVLLAGQNLTFDPEKKRVLRMPIRLNHNLILIPIQINNSDELKFILDSGIQAAILTELAMGQELSLTYAREVELRGLGNGERVKALQSSGNRFKIGQSITGWHQFMFVMLKDIFQMSTKLGERVHGLIGYPVFKSFVIHVNYHSRWVSFYRPDAFRPPKGNKYIRLPLSIEDTKAYVWARAVQESGDTVAVKLLLDTGASHALWLNVHDHERLRMPEAGREMFLGRGLNGDIRGQMGRISTLLLGDFALRDPLVAFPDSASAHEVFAVGERDGALGGEVLRRFDVTIDYPNQMLYLRPNRYANDPFEYNMSGLEITNPLPGLPFFEV
ncbi:MAG: aspartyl protease family protein, partial [Bernardetiaceae bacterium]